MKKYFALLIFATALTSTPLYAAEEEFFDEVPELEVNSVQINVSGSQVRITGAAGQTLEVYNIAGVRVATVTIDSDDRTVSLNLSKGCYILKVGKVVRKVSIR